MKRTQQEILELYEKYYEMVWRICLVRFGNAHDAYDAAQETFVRLMNYTKSFHSGEHEKAWLIRTTIHICMDMLKSSWHRRTVPFADSLQVLSGEIDLPYQLKDDRALEAVLKLPVHYRNPLYLFYYEDYSIQEIAGVLHEKEGTIKTRLRRGREEVKKILTERRP